ncbi:MAG: spore coat protein CotJB [Acutalibacteraceae bacterium]
MTEKEKLMKQLQMYHFAALDAALFLDTHPNDKEALAYFNRVKKLADGAREDFERKYGPVRMGDTGESNKWDWALQPWPWESEA